MIESKADELRRLAQAVVDAWEAWRVASGERAESLARNALDRAVCAAGFTVNECRTILAALADATAQGEARERERLAAVLALLRARVASGDVRACVLREAERLIAANHGESRN